MKKACIATMVLVLIVTGTALAGGQGAVKVPFDTEVGWVVLNTTGDGRLLATVHLENAEPGAEYGINVRVRHEDQTTETFADVATLTTNGQGRGNAQLHLLVSPPEGSSTLRRVAVRVRRAPDPVYVAVAWDVPLK